MDGAGPSCTIQVATAVILRMLSLIFLFALPAFAGQGWYLLVPGSEAEADRLRPDLRRWVQFGAYDAASDCQRGLERRSKEAEERRESPEASPFGKQAASEVYMRLISARCIASDDPRLK